jgi:predicted permease
MNKLVNAMNKLAQDLRFAARQLRRAPGFTLTAVLTLGLGIGATAAVFSVIQMVLLSPLPYTEPERLVGLDLTFPHERPDAEQTGASADFLRENMSEFSSSAVMDDGALPVNLSLDAGHAAQVISLRASEGYFRTLGAQPALGRTYTPDEDRPGGARVTVLSHGLWVRQFASDPAIVGKAIRINQETYTVIGVMPASFAVTAETMQGVFGTPDLWRPLQLGPKDPGYDGDNYKMIARLRPGISLLQVQQHLSALIVPFYQKFPDYKNWFDKAHQLHEFQVWSLQDVLVSQVRRSLLTVFGAVIAVLLVACLNLAGLMLARSMRRSREIAVRSALGATRGQLVRLLWSEGLLLACSGGLLAIVVARVSCDLLLHAAPLAVPELSSGPSLGLTSGVVFGIALLSACIFALCPAFFLLRRVGRETRLGGPSLGETISHARLSRSLIVVQVGLAMVLLSAASVLLGTFLKLQVVPSGVEPKQLSVFQVALAGEAYASTRRTTQFVAAVLEELRRQPGVERVAAVNGLPLDHGLNVGGYPVGYPEHHQVIEFRTVTPGYFRTMGIALLAGRDIAEDDRAGSDRVVLISAAAARKYWPGKSAVGEAFRVGNETNWRIVGVVADTHEHSLVSSGDVVLYAPMAQLSDEFTGIINGWFPTTFAIRTAARVDLASAARQAVEHADAQIPIARFTTMQAVIDSTIQDTRFFTYLAAGFALFALVLTIIGLFGLLSYQVTQRTREIGVRMALGADRADILRAILARGLMIVSIGIGVGLAGAWLVRPVLNRLLNDAGIDAGKEAQALVISPPLGSLAAAAAIFLAAMAASWLPARRAASVEPMQALRTE